MEDLRQLFQLINRRFGLLNENCCSLGDQKFSLIQSEILYEIDRQRQASMQQVAASLGMEITRFSHQIHTLIRKGLVIKKASEMDKRVFVLSLTTEGKFVATMIDERIKEQLQQVLNSMNDNDKETVLRALTLLNKSMQIPPSCCT
ncbi:MarR family winged helix-turn-helix transcriptional regulator [Paenibacillus sp. EPM92]|uniref:MarR family winged helix-turn-helix transcriptional regulator n=1 Tax=Paenibacillus sp. EPM92 TaxID=1561195 RepID=UPI0019163030|nr:MarR family transcriptional regulator [Paenibacillus sp. EPM92]